MRIEAHGSYPRATQASEDRVVVTAEPFAESNYGRRILS